MKYYCYYVKMFKYVVITKNSDFPIMWILNLVNFGNSFHQSINCNDYFFAAKPNTLINVDNCLDAPWLLAEQ